ncbi:MAG: nitrate reductase subunit beta [Epsilonproteobacteria bacterium]|nr:nitrate reductase subunit beta [Campylobacterota bacterium]
MNIRTQISMVFHLDKCIGCHTCSIACKNLWTDRKGAEYMWWNNVETKPGTGYPTKWEEQSEYKGGWEIKGDMLKPKMNGRWNRLLNIFSSPPLPTIDDYYEPWTYRYEDLFNAPEGDDQPTARPISLITGESINIEAGPNWDDDLSGSTIYARNDPNLENLTELEREQLNELERLVFFYIPRMCNHCLNPACVATCPSGAIYKRGEDGIVLIDQKKCRGWRMCVSGCPYKKSYYNWNTGKSEKCILCFPRLETGQVPACMHSCVGRIRYLGVMLYDADKIENSAKVSDNKLVDTQLDMILDPFDEKVITAAKTQGIHDEVIISAQNSPTYKFVKQWKVALPLHPEFRTLPMLFYVPPLSPIIAKMEGGKFDVVNADSTAQTDHLRLFHSLTDSRVPIKYLASLFSAGDTSKIDHIYKKLIAVRLCMRSITVGDVAQDDLKKTFEMGNTNAEEAVMIYRLTSLPSIDERFVIPPMYREEAIESFENVYDYKSSAGFGFVQKAERRL